VLGGMLAIVVLVVRYRSEILSTPGRSAQQFGQVPLKGNVNKSGEQGA
jgi:hypothetical protein